MENIDLHQMVLFHNRESERLSTQYDVVHISGFYEIGTPWNSALKLSYLSKEMLYRPNSIHKISIFSTRIWT